MIVRIAAVVGAITGGFALLGMPDEPVQPMETAAVACVWALDVGVCLDNPVDALP